MKKLFLGLLCMIPSTLITQPSLINQVATTGQNHQTALTGACVAAAAVGYIGYALYLDHILNTPNSFWYWSIHNIRGASIDEGILLDYVQESHANLYAIHPLAAVYAMIHAVDQEINYCLAFAGILNILRACKLSWIVSETRINLDKKLEHLYLLKNALASCGMHVRSRCKNKVLNAV